MSTSEIIEIGAGKISTIKLLDWLEQLMVIRRTIIWIGSPGPGWIDTNYETFFFTVEGLEICQHFFCVGYVHFNYFTFNIFLLSSTNKIQNCVGSHFADKFLVGQVIFFLNQSHHFHLPFTLFLLLTLLVAVLFLHCFPWTFYCCWEPAASSGDWQLLRCKLASI